MISIKVSHLKAKTKVMGKKFTLESFGAESEKGHPFMSRYGKKKNQSEVPYL